MELTPDDFFILGGGELQQEWLDADTHNLQGKLVPAWLTAAKAKAAECVGIDPDPVATPDPADPAPVIPAVDSEPPALPEQGGTVAVLTDEQKQANYTQLVLARVYELAYRAIVSSQSAKHKTESSGTTSRTRSESGIVYFKERLAHYEEIRQGLCRLPTDPVLPEAPKAFVAGGIATGSLNSDQSESMADIYGS